MDDDTRSNVVKSCLVADDYNHFPWPVMLEDPIVRAEMYGLGLNVILSSLSNFDSDHERETYLLTAAVRAMTQVEVLKVLLSDGGEEE